MYPHTVLLVGGTGRTGSRVLEQLLGRGVCVRAIVRSPQKLPASVLESPDLDVIEASLLSLSDDALERCVRGCDAVVSCLGHPISIKGVLGAPRDLVTSATTKLCRAIEGNLPDEPVKFILMTSVSVNHPAGFDEHRGGVEKAFLWTLRGILPPAKDNQEAASFLYDQIGPKHPFVQWVILRPDTLLEGPISEYTLDEGLLSSLFAPDQTNMANIAHFVCELVTSPNLWKAWKGKLPVIVNASVAQAACKSSPREQSSAVGD